MKILLAEDSEILRELLAEVLQKDHVIVRASTGKSLLEQFKIEKPDIIISDICFADLDGLQIAEKIKSLNPHIQYILFTAHKNKEFIRQALRIKINAFIFKQEGFLQDLDRAINLLNNDQVLLGRGVGEYLIGKSDNEFLTRRELEILQYMKDGKTSEAIANLLFISRFTVDNHRKNIKRKLNYSNMVDLLRMEL